ncbi:MAG: hypothetical protein MJY94_01195 [Bacteroidales bacterium]|nr:hypothetical protein [Bacteroidales bacterium]
MEILKVSSQEYKQTFPNPFSLFNSVEFSELNRYKCMSLHYLIFSDTKKRLGVILGETDESLMMPFSASYGGFSFNSNVPVQYYDDACKELKKYGESVGKQIRITLSPSLYNTMDNAKSFGALMRAGATIISVEYNHYFDLSRFDNYDRCIDSKAKNKLHKAIALGLRFQKLSSNKIEDIERVYRIIQINHSEKGRPLRMSLQNVLDTIKIIPADFFIVTSNDGVDIAAAQVFCTSLSTVQVVYWGDNPKYSSLKSMNFLSYKIFEYYRSTDYKIVDVGISTEDGKPNYGLCEFKENIGCLSTSRFTLVL